MEAYAINIALNLRANVGGSQVLIRELGLVQTHALRVRGILGTLGVGFTVAAGIREIAKATSDYAHEAQKLQTVLQDATQLQTAISAAQRVSTEVPTTNYTDNIKAISDLYGVFNGNLQEIIAELPAIQQISTAMDAMGKKIDGKEIYSTARAVELTGLSGDDPRFAKRMSEIGRVSEFTHGRVNGQQYAAFNAMSLPFVTGYNDDFMYRYAPSLIQDRGSGSAAGTGLTTFEQSMFTRMTKATFQTAQSLGLIKKDAVVDAGSMGRMTLRNPNDLLGEDLRLKDPYTWSKQYLFPILDKMKTDAERQQTIAKLFPDRTAARTEAIFYTRRSQFDRDAPNIAATQDPISAAKRLMESDPKILGTEIWKQFQDVLVNIGHEALPTVLPLMRGFRDLLVDINKAFQGLDSWKNVLVTAGLLEKRTTDATPPYEKGGIKDWLVRHGVVGAQQASAIGPPPMNHTIVVESTVRMPDNTVLGKAVTKYQSNQMNGTANSASSFDRRRGFTPPGLAY